MTGKQLKNSILQWAIQGKLVPQDPNDEPASVLLEKIRAEKARLIKEGKIKKDKKESIIYRGEDNSYYEKFTDGKVVCIDDEIPFDLPNTWKWCRLSSLIWGTGAGKSPNCDKRPKKDNEWGVLTTTAIQYCDFLPNENKVLPTNYIVNQEQEVKHEDLLITRAGPRNRTGIVCVVNKTCNNLILSDKTVRIEYVREYCNPYYLMYALNSPTIHDNVMAATVGMAASQVNISQNSIQNISIPLPPYKEQKRIVNRLNTVLPYLKKYSTVKEQQDKLNENIGSLLKKSILQEAIQGRLVPQNASEEPANLLLQRIKEEKLRLVKEGKLKNKDVIDSTIFRGDDNKYYEQVDGDAMQIESDYTFPDSWGVVRLAHICRLMDGEKKEDNYVCLDAKYLRGKSSGDILSKGKFVSKGDNIILVDGENSGEVFAVPHNGYMGSTFKQLWVSSCMHLPYVLYFIQFYKDLLRNSKKGAAIPHLNKEIFYSLLIGIPPYQEQERIASAIEELYACL